MTVFATDGASVFVFQAGDILGHHPSGNIFAWSVLIKRSDVTVITARAGFGFPLPHDLITCSRSYPSGPEDSSALAAAVDSVPVTVASVEAFVCLFAVWPG